MRDSRTYCLCSIKFSAIGSVPFCTGHARNWALKLRDKVQFGSGCVFACVYIESAKLLRLALSSFRIKRGFSTADSCLLIRFFFNCSSILRRNQSWKNLNCWDLNLNRQWFQLKWWLRCSFGLNAMNSYKFERFKIKCDTLLAHAQSFWNLYQQSKDNFRQSVLLWFRIDWLIDIETIPLLSNERKNTNGTHSLFHFIFSFLGIFPVLFSPWYFSFVLN